MKNIFLCGVLLLSLTTGCSSVWSALPDEFWAYGTWRYDGDENVLTVAATGTAFITMHFTRQQDEQYLIDGTVTYDESSLSCDVFALGEKPTCTTDTCALSEIIPGELSGVAVVRDDKLIITQHWVTKPDERYTWICKEGVEGGSVTQSNWSVWQTMGPNGAGIVDDTWEVDIADAAFIDDLPLGEVTDEKTISVNFDVRANDNVEAIGLIGFYRQLP